MEPETDEANYPYEDAIDAAFNTMTMRIVGEPVAKPAKTVSTASDVRNGHDLKKILDTGKKRHNPMKPFKAPKEVETK